MAVRKKFIGVLVATVLSALVFSGLACESDSPSGSDTEVIQTDPVTQANAMPGGEGSSWSYAIHSEIWRRELNPASIYETLDEVPDPLTLSEVLELSANHGALPSIDTEVGSLDWTVHFAMVFGDTLSWLMESTTLWPRARGEVDGLLPTGVNRQHYSPMLIGADRLWQYPDWLGIPGNVDTSPLPILQGNLQPGDEFAAELFHGVTLHCRVLGEVRVPTPAGFFADGLHCFYYFELPPAGILDPEGGGPGDVIGYVRALSYGHVYWVGGIGPVRSDWRRMVTVGSSVDEGMGRVVTELTGASNLSD